MISPSKILLFCVVLTACVAYFGDNIMTTLNHIARNTKQANLGAQDDFSDNAAAEGGRSGDIHVPMKRDGHYWITLEVNGQPTDFMVDTGASHIMLSYEAAEAAGLNPAVLDYNQPFQTANGVTQKAMITINNVSHGSLRLYDLEASVSGAGQMDISLLGMSFLNRLSGFTIENKVLILKP